MGNVLKLAPAKKTRIIEPKSHEAWVLQTRAELLQKGFRSCGSLAIDIQLRMPNAPRKEFKMETIIEAEDAPKNCDICDTPIVDEFIDGVVKNGPWGNMCPTCHRNEGIGLGTGRGQHYKKNADGNFYKCEIPSEPKPL